MQQGDLIGYTGHSGVGTGPHLHFEVWRDGEAIDPRRDPNMQWGLARDGDASAPMLAASANPGGELVAHRERHLPGSPTALLALLDAPAADGDYSAKPAWMAATGIAGRDWSEVSLREALAVAPSAPDAQGLGIGRYGLPLDRLGQFAERLQLSGDETLTPALQDRLALALAYEAGVNDWLEGRIDQGQWQANLTRLRTTLT